MDHRTFLANIPAQTRVALLARSNRAGLIHLALHWGLLAACCTLIVAKPPFWWLLLPVQGVVLMSNFTLMHECTHRTPFRTPWLNNVIGWIVGLAIGLPFLWFRYFHMAHHRHTNDPLRDPELQGPGKPTTRMGTIFYISGCSTWIAAIRTLLRNALGRTAEDFLPETVGRKVQVESIIMILFYMVTGLYSFFFLPVLLWLWPVPLLLGQPFLRVFLLAEHGHCPFVANMLENSRTTFTHAVVRFLCWNMPYHAEHHSYPMVPFHNLPALHRLAKPHLAVTENGYRAFVVSYFRKLGL